MRKIAVIALFLLQTTPGFGSDIAGRGTVRSLRLIPTGQSINSEQGSLERLRVLIRGDMQYSSHLESVVVEAESDGVMGHTNESWQGMYYLYRNSAGAVFAQHAADAEIHQNRGPFHEVGRMGNQEEFQLVPGFAFGRLIFIIYRPGLLARWIDGARPSQVYYPELRGPALTRGY